ncbi:MAG: phenylalanine--tRNA ligase subunit beta [Candidatus Eisenbacteria bacterium]|nr:phenylalanine--tRNA ligase subunit beta [Candidatus Eisenbacteria bacterium]
MAQGGAAMPVIGIPLRRLRELLGESGGGGVSAEELVERLGHLGCDVEGTTELQRVRCSACGAIYEMTATEEVPPRCEACGAELRGGHERLAPLEVIRMELLAVRPDMFDPGGLARVLRGYLGVETGRPDYPLGEPAAEVTVDAALRDPASYRPQIACAVIEDVDLDEGALKILMKLQENLHWAIGRDRKHASIGVYDFDRVEPQIEYVAEDPEQFRFRPLGAAPSDRSQRLHEILQTHPKGMAYAHLLAAHQRYPLLRDAAGVVLSMPPIINSEETRVRSSTRRLFIDVTGMRRRVVERTLNIVVTSLLENLRGARAATVRVRDADGERLTPDFTPQEAWVDAHHAARILGIELSPAEAADALRRMRHDVTEAEDGRLRVAVPAYRNDILHEIDLIEDIAIAYGYHRIIPTLVPTFTVGEEHPLEATAQSARALLCGLGFLEVMTLVLTSDEAHDELLGWEPDPRRVQIANPISREQTRVRTSLLPGLLATLRHNATRPLPQMIFEVGDVSLLDPQAETGARELRRLACGIVSPRTGFEEIKAVAEAILREFAREAELTPSMRAPLMRGRAAEAPGGRASDPNLFFGEVHPEVLERYGLQNPAVLLEVDLDWLSGEPEGGRADGNAAARVTDRGGGEVP